MRSWMIAAVTALMLALPTVASAAVKPLDPEVAASATAADKAILADPSILVGSGSLPEYAYGEEAEGDDEDASPLGIGETPLADFPTDGTAFGVLSSGDVNTLNDPAVINDPEAQAEETTYEFPSQFPEASTRGSADDWTVLSLKVAVPAGANCLALDYRFLSEEYPNYVGSEFNDAFIGEVGPSTWSVAEDGVISRATDFATALDGPPASVNGVGPTAMSPAEAAGTYFNAATGLVTTKTPIAAGEQQLELSIFDANDAQLDSAAFVDNLRFVNESPTTCKPPSGAQLEIKTNPPPAPPSNAFTVGSSVKFKAHGSQATITVTVPGPGTVSASSPTTATASAARASVAAVASKKKKGKKKPVLKPASVHAAAAGPVSLTLKLSSAGKAALRKKGKLKVGVAITFTPDGGSAATQTTSVTFKAAKKKKKHKK